ncbi:CehA/McbA family metallohydrolase [Pendulispora rubella]|uniref:CehA/McbA family metallohydrolase n=1 Tax=Pendulispora rubella TaxID=2741070 RepID=A0ABZ2L3Y3_9BACT
MKRGDWIATAILAGLLGFALTRGPGRAVPRPPRGTAVAKNAPRLGPFAIEPARITAVFGADAHAIPMDLALGVDGDLHPLSLSDVAVLPDGRVRGTFEVDLEREAITGAVTFHLEASKPATAVLAAELSLADPIAATAHALAIAVELEGGAPAFVSGVGEISDAARVSGRVAVREDDVHPLGVVSPQGPLDVRRHPTHGPDDEHGDGPMDLILSSPPARDAIADLRIAVAGTAGDLWGTLFAQGQIPTEPVHGVVTGTRRGSAHVFGLDASGAPSVRTSVDNEGRFALDVPRTVNKWYAAESLDRTSAPIVFEPGTPWDLRLDVSPGGELRVRIVDPDTQAPLTARLIVHGIDGTLDPSFGPDYRASGAGPIVDALRGEVATPLPAGRYRVSATKGIEYTVDAKTIELAGDRTVSLELHLRHVVPTPGVLGCDLHVHARPSFDTPVSVEDRVLSLAAAGVDFAVPSEHNVVGNYAPALESLELTREMSSVPGVEITTFIPYFGHFGLFPYPLDATVPPFRHTNPSAIFDAARRGDPNRILQVNHPRLSKEIGYFDAMGFDPHGRPPPRMRTDFDSIEVYNGYEMQSQERVDLVLRDYFGFLNQGRHITATGSSDSHSIQYQWAGYPRTMVDVGQAADGDLTGLNPLDVVANLKRGHAVVTSGPIVEVEARSGAKNEEIARPGDELVLRSDGASIAHIRVRAAPWVDVTSVEIVVDGAPSSRFDVPSQPTKIGNESGTLVEAAARMVRFERDLQLPLSRVSRDSQLSTTNPDSHSAGNNQGSPALSNGPKWQVADTRRHWFVVIVRGTRRIDDVLPFMPVAPMAITNPIWYQTSTIGADSSPSRAVGPGAKMSNGGRTH